MTLIHDDSRCGVVCACCCVHISAWREAAYSQAQRIKGEVGRTVSLLGCCLRDAYRNWTQQRRHQTTCIMESCHPGPLSGEEVNQRLEVTVWLKISGLWMMNARWSLFSVWWVSGHISDFLYITYKNGWNLLTGCNKWDSSFCNCL